ncbi:hypothetical protein SXCC_00227 [Gluconacetobacter sp. SXCC-1]|nr:hypothetical protein SXCC_04839 [Gluconacetobacter sp. SXCC-1]EGG75009.1 hypothetical protein SXCC_04380 [Gluconacetobacter sp. SXCC-1]EGG75320.1 hypothetical protein SXCC_04230 [Gluconacetobacter sp. SXCC-1]EGG75690.1 hypothetical protein SXCC_03504 [Gluconacetobacter sp. SXCC-1]EGG75753.1 hypothetical protein SXCC_03568 [Gluconacetobacter sp. SXCC-1]
MISVDYDSWVCDNLMRSRWPGLKSPARSIAGTTWSMQATFAMRSGR